MIQDAQAEEWGRSASEWHGMDSLYAELRAQLLRDRTLPWVTVQALLNGPEKSVEYTTKLLDTLSIVAGMYHLVMCM